MKKVCAAVSLAIVMVMLSSVFCFGAECLKTAKMAGPGSRRDRPGKVELVRNTGFF